MLDTDAETYGRWSNVLLGKFLWRALAVSGGIWMDNQRLDICHIGQEREELQVVDKGPSLFLTAIDLYGEDRAGSLWEVLLVEGMILVACQ